MKNIFKTILMMILVMIPIACTEKKDASPASTNNTTTTADAGQALETIVATDKITASDTGLPSGSAARTVEFWLKTTQTTGERYAVSYGTLSSGKALYVGVNQGYANVTQIGDSFLGSTPIADGKWHHLAVVLPGGTQAYELYVDGKKDGGKAMNTNTTLKGLVIGSTVEGENKPIVGQIDEVRIWNVARTVTQIKATMNSKLNGDEVGLVLYYDMNVTGTGAGVFVKNKASTGAPNDGTTVGSPTFVASTAFSGSVTPTETPAPATTSSTTVGGTIAITVGTGLTPTYSWTGDKAYQIQVMRISAQTVPVWGLSTNPLTAGLMANGITSPITHGTIPAGVIESSATEKNLTSGIAYRVSITRMGSADSSGWADFTASDGSAPATTSTPVVTSTPATTTTPATSTIITNTGGTIAITVGNGFHPAYSWTGEKTKEVRVMRKSAPTVPVWGLELNPFSYTGGAITSPITHGTVPAGIVGSTITAPETKLTSGVGYKVSITNIKDESGWAEFTAGGTNPPVIAPIGGAGIKVTQGTKSYTLQTGSTINFKYLQANDRELDPAGAKDTDKVRGIYIRVSGVKMAGVGLTIKFSFPEKLVSEIRGKPLTEEDFGVSMPWEGTETFTYMNMWIDLESGMSDAGGKIFAIKLSSAGVPFNGTITNNGVSGDQTNPLTEFAFDLP